MIPTSYNPKKLDISLYLPKASGEMYPAFSSWSSGK